ncbi:TPA: hypothetical protein H1629_003193, partial [Listeria monocytogenes]|nr:hypothetical protein [Listeria monocytogenes]
MEKHKTFKNILMIDGLITTRFDSGYILDAISEGLFSKGGCALVIGINEESMSVG